MCDLQETKISKDKAKELGLEILLSAKISNAECAKLLGFADAGSSKSLGKREVIKTMKDVVIENNKKEKWKTKSGMLETKESARMTSMKLPQFTKRG